MFGIAKAMGDLMEFKVFLERDKKGLYVAEVPALPGCVLQGRTEEEAIKNIKEAIQLYLEVTKKGSKYKAPSTSYVRLVTVNV